MGWIAVVDQLPPRTKAGWVGPYLVRYSTGEMVVESHWSYGKSAYWSSENRAGVAVKATHWMPLPEQPVN